MVDNISTNERVEASKGGQLQNNLVLRLERNISQLEQEVAHMRDLSKLSISLGTQENIDNVLTKQTCQTILQSIYPHLNPLVQIPFHHPTPKIPKFRFTTITNIPNQPSQKQPQTQISHILLGTTIPIPYTLKLPL